MFILLVVLSLIDHRSKNKHISTTIEIFIFFKTIHSFFQMNFDIKSLKIERIVLILKKKISEILFSEKMNNEGRTARDLMVKMIELFSEIIEENLRNDEHFSTMKTH